MTAASVLIQGANVVDVTDNCKSRRCDIRITGPHISAMQPALTPETGEEVIAATGMVAIPGFVQAHMHVCQTLFRGLADDVDLMMWLQERIWPLEAALTPEDVRAAARLGMAELLLGGTTSILDMGSAHHTDVVFAEAARIGLRYTGGKTVMDQGQGLPARLREKTDDALAASVALCERWHNSHAGLLRYAFSPRMVLSCSDTLLTGCVQEARRRGAWLHSHAAENIEEVALIRSRTGRGTVEHLHGLGFTGHDVVLAHGIWLSAEEQRLIRTTGTHIAHCPSSNLKLANGIAHVADMIESGISVALGADGAACANALDAFQEMRLAALLHKVRSGASAIPAAQALTMATSGGARALGLQDCGSLAPGKQADIVLVDMRKPHLFPDFGDVASRLVYAGRPADVHTVFVQGRKVVQDGRLAQDDLPVVLAEAQQAADRVRKRVFG